MLFQERVSQVQLPSNSQVTLFKWVGEVVFELTEVLSVTCPTPKTQGLKSPIFTSCHILHCDSSPMKTAFWKSCKTIYYWFSLTINIKLKPRSDVAADRPLFVFPWAAVLPTVWGWSRIDGKHSCVFVKRHTLASKDLLSISVPRKHPVWAAVHLTAQPHTLRGEHIQPSCPFFQFWRRNF